MKEYLIGWAGLLFVFVAIIVFSFIVTLIGKVIKFFKDDVKN